MGLQHKIILKRGCRIRLTTNVNNVIGVCNNAPGTLRDFVFDKDNVLTFLLIELVGFA